MSGTNRGASAQGDPTGRQPSPVDAGTSPHSPSTAWAGHSHVHPRPVPGKPTTKTAALPDTNNGARLVAGAGSLQLFPARIQYAQHMLKEPLRKLETTSSLPPPSPQGQHWGRVTVATGATHREGLVGASIQVGGTTRSEGMGRGGMQVSVKAGLQACDQCLQAVHLSQGTGSVHI